MGAVAAPLTPLTPLTLHTDDAELIDRELQKRNVILLVARHPDQELQVPLMVEAERRG